MRLLLALTLVTLSAPVLADEHSADWPKIVQTYQTCGGKPLDQINIWALKGLMMWSRSALGHEAMIKALGIDGPKQEEVGECLWNSWQKRAVSL